MIGIPYASAEWDDTLRCIVRVCPVCEARIPEPSDPYGEPFVNAYGHHYITHHDTKEN